MTRFELLEILWSWKCGRTILLSIGVIEIDYGPEPALFTIGILEGCFEVDILYSSWFIGRYKQWKDNE